MNKRGDFDRRDAEILLIDVICDTKIKEKYKKLFEANRKIRGLIRENKLCMDSIQAVLSILCQIKVIEFIYTALPDKDRKNFQTNRGEFKSDSEFFEFIFMNQILEVEEKKIKIELAYIIEEFLKELRKLEKRKRRL